jgi:hypothetical protein
MKKRFLALIFAVISLVSTAAAQQAEVTIQLNEPFFDALLDAIFKNTNGLEFGIAAASPKSKVKSLKSAESPAFVSSFSENGSEIRNPKSEIPNCNEVIRLQRERDGVKTSVRFRDGRISAPIAFTGSYNPPLIGCVDFAGVAETNIELEFDRQRQALVGRARVLNVNLSGTGGIGGGLLARIVQNSIDKKINPIEILQMEKVSFVVPIQNAGNLRMKAVGMKHEVANGFLNVRVVYEFQKAE